ncbi:MAG TPA: DUF192 domain-containing protein [Terriglobales bacterium]|jgi:hypothetical protein
MPLSGPAGYAFNRTRQSYLATQLSVADTHWSRFMGLMGKDSADFSGGQGLWITPSHGVHTFAMRFPIDVIYLDGRKIIVHLEKRLKPWRMAPVRMGAASVIELPEHTLDQTGTAVGDEIEIAMGQPRETNAS